MSAKRVRPIDTPPPSYLDGLVLQMIKEWPDSEDDVSFADRITRAVWAQIIAQEIHPYGIGDSKRYRSVPVAVLMLDASRPAESDAT